MNANFFPFHDFIRPPDEFFFPGGWFTDIIAPYDPETDNGDTAFTVNASDWLGIMCWVREWTLAGDLHLASGVEGPFSGVMKAIFGPHARGIGPGTLGDCAVATKEGHLTQFLGWWIDGPLPSGWSGGGDTFFMHFGSAVVHASTSLDAPPGYVMWGHGGTKGPNCLIAPNDEGSGISFGAQPGDNCDFTVTVPVRPEIKDAFSFSLKLGGRVSSGGLDNLTGVAGMTASRFWTYDDGVNGPIFNELTGERLRPWPGIQDVPNLPF